MWRWRRAMAGGVLMAGMCGASSLPERGIPQSCGVQLKTHNFSVETLNEVHELGFRIVRRGFYWTSVEKAKGTYTFEDYDKQMARAKELGLTVIGVLFSVHKEYEDNGQGGIQTEAGRRGFAGFAAALAEHYSEQNVIWEVWNEPNVRTFWRKNGTHNSAEFAEEYSALVKETVPAMLAVDPDCSVVAGSVSNYWEPSYTWTESCFRSGILESGIRGWSVHPYGVKTPEEFEIGHTITRALLSKYGAPDMPMLDTERGFSVEETQTGSRVNEGWSGGDRAGVLQYQAWNLVRQFLVDQLCGVRLTMWYEWDGDKFGIKDRTGAGEARTACSEMLRQLNGYHFAGRITSNHYRDYLLLFEGPDKARKLVAWTCPPAAGTPDNVEDHEVTLTVAGVSNANGAFGDVVVNGDAVTLKLTGKPAYYPVPDGAEITKCVSHAKYPLAADDLDTTPQLLTGPVDLELFADDSKWEFIPNTGAGSFKLTKAEGGTPIGVLAYDFTNPTGKSTPYVLGSVSCEIGKGPENVTIQARSAIKQRLTFRLIDSTGQTHQKKSKIKGTGAWEAITIPLTKRMEHWGGANDGVIHYPIKSILLSVPLPGPDHKTGKVEYTRIGVE